MLIKTLLNKIERFKSFVYGTTQVILVGEVEALVIDIVPRRNSQPICPEFGKRRTVRRHWDGILSWFDGHLNNGGVEGTNSMIQAAKARAKDYGTTRHLILWLTWLPAS